MMTRAGRYSFGFGALLALGATQVACGSDTDTGGGAAGAAQAGRSGGVSGGGATAAGGSGTAVSAGSAGSGVGGSAAGSGGVSGGSAAGSGGSMAGSGGSSAGSAGSTAGRGGAGGAASGSGGSANGMAGSGGGSAGGGNTVTFSAVSALLTMTCNGGTCHGGGNEVNLTNATGLYARLTTPLAGSVGHCKATTLVVKNDASSFLLKILKGAGSCMNNGAPQQIPRMPDNCSTTSGNPRPCLTAAQIKTVDDWITSGAPGPM